MFCESSSAVDWLRCQPMVVHTCLFNFPCKQIHLWLYVKGGTPQWMILGWVLLSVSCFQSTQVNWSVWEKIIYNRTYMLCDKYLQYCSRLFWWWQDLLLCSYFMLIFNELPTRWDFYFVWVRFLWSVICDFSICGNVFDCIIVKEENCVCSWSVVSL